MNKTVNINSQLYETLKDEAKYEKVDLKEHIETVLRNHEKKMNMLGTIFFGLQVEKVEDEKVILKNLPQRKFYDVQVKDKSLYCEQDRSKGCEHTSFVWLKAEELDILN